jgi:signal transduction histidine kinase
VLSDLLRPWREGRTWWALCHVCLDPILGTLSFTVVVTLLSLSLGLAITLPLAIPSVWLLFVVARGMGRVERSRLHALLGLDLPDPHGPLAAASWWRRLVERLGSATRWREVAYLLALLPVGCATFALSVATWSAGMAALALPAYVSSLPDGQAELGLVDVRQGAGAALASLLGAGLLVAAPWVTRGMAGIDGRLARALLGGRSRVAELSAQLVRTEVSRSAAVEAAETERRRIERDLHDGAQQRLVALAMDLGQAREKMAVDPEGARRLVEEAHEESKRALAELRDLVRGIHPAILEDRGLDAALSAVVARCPVPVDLRVTGSRRPPPAIESAAYFVVAEALTNVTRHSQATRATVSIATTPDRVVVEVTDDGVGGADATRGTGLSGLAERVQAVGGWLHVLSPAGGPTTIVAELPCGS